MSSTGRIRADAELRDLAESAIDEPSSGRYRVLLEGVRAEYETSESFAIKFGLAISEPVTKIKHMLRRLPARVWEGQSASRAAGLLAIIEEAGGRGRIEEVARPKQPDPAGSTERSEAQAEQTGPDKDDARRTSSVCPKCGFPSREGEKHCQFCLSRLEERSGRRPKRQAAVATGSRAASIPSKRLLIYALIVLAAVLISRLF